MGKLVQIVFSFWVWTASFVWMAFLAIATMLLAPIFSYRRVHRYVPAAGFAWIPRFAFSPLTKTFDPTFDPKRKSVFCFNHTNLLDAHITSATIPHAFCGLMNAWQFHIPFYGWLMWLSKGIPVHRGKGREIQKAITEAAKNRKELGYSILVFPEAHRTRDGQIQKYHKGVFKMARDAGYPVVNCSIRGSFAVNQKGSFLFSPGPIHVHVGPQVETEGLTDEAIGQLAKSFEETTRAFVEGKEKLAA